MSVFERCYTNKIIIIIIIGHIVVVVVSPFSLIIMPCPDCGITAKQFYSHPAFLSTTYPFQDHAHVYVWTFLLL